MLKVPIKDNIVHDMKRLFSFSLLLFSVVSVIAGRDYHGRYYSIYDRSDPTFAYLFLILVAIGFVYLLIAGAVQNIQKKITTDKTQNVQKELTYHTCSICGGEGFLKGEQFYPSKCSYCKGYGKELTPEMETLIEKISQYEKEDEEYRMDREKRKEEIMRKKRKEEAKTYEEVEQAKLRYLEKEDRKIGDFNYKASDLPKMTKEEFEKIETKYRNEDIDLKVKISTKIFKCKYCKDKKTTDGETCKYCGGLGIRFKSEEAKTLYYKEKNLSKEILLFGYGYDLLTGKTLESSLRSLDEKYSSYSVYSFWVVHLEGNLRSKLNEAPKCSHCHGTGLNIDCSYTVENDYSGEKYYKTTKCIGCNGRGYVYW